MDVHKKLRPQRVERLWQDTPPRYDHIEVECLFLMLTHSTDMQDVSLVRVDGQFKELMGREI